MNNFNNIVSLTTRYVDFEDNEYITPIEADTLNIKPDIGLEKYSLGITYQKIKNTSIYLGLSYTKINFLIPYGDSEICFIDSNGDCHGFNSEYYDYQPNLIKNLYSLYIYEYVGIDLGLVYIPYLMEQYSGISFNLGYKYDFNLGQGFQAGIGYRF